MSILPQYQTVAAKNISNFLSALTNMLGKYPSHEEELISKAYKIIATEKMNFKDKVYLELTQEYFEACFSDALVVYSKKSISELLRSDQPVKKESKSKLKKAKKEEKPVVSKNRFQTSRFAYMLLMVLSVVGFLECYTIYSTWKAEEAKTDALMTDLLASTEITEQEVDIEEIYNVADDSKTANLKKKDKYGSDYWDYANVALMDVNFDKLLKKNRDTVGWLYVNNTNINYPFVQGEDNSYYLNRAFDGTKSAAGWLFADYRSDLTNFKRNTVIYGHGRVDQVMFGSLEKVLKNLLVLISMNSLLLKKQ